MPASAAVAMDRSFLRPEDRPRRQEGIEDGEPVDRVQSCCLGVLYDTVIAFICSARSAARRIHSSRVWGCVHQVGPDGGFEGGGGFFIVFVWGACYRKRMPKATMKSDAGRLLGRLRWKGRTAAERSAHGLMMRHARTAKEKAATSKKSA